MGKVILEPYETYYKDMRWKDVYINGEKTKYKISDKGILLSFIGKYPREMSGHIMTNGYVIHALHHNGKIHWMLEHRLVAMAFIPISDELKEYSFDDLEVNHKKR